MIELASGGPARWGLSAQALAEGRVATIATHMFSHAGLAHLFLNAGALQRFAGPVVRRLGWRPPGLTRFAFLYLLSGLAAAVFFLVLNSNGSTPMVGASGAICGLWGASMRLPPRGGESLRSMRDPEVLRSLGGFAVSNVLLFAILFALSGGGSGGLAWEAHLGGLLFGLLAFPMFVDAADRERSKGEATKTGGPPAVGQSPETGTRETTGTEGRGRGSALSC